MDFEIVGPIEAIETIAVGSKIRDLVYLQKIHGRGPWRKLKGIASVRIQMVKSVVLNFIGTKLTELVVKT